MRTEKHRLSIPALWDLTLRHFETDSEARSEVQRVFEKMRELGVEVETIFEDTTKPKLA